MVGITPASYAAKLNLFVKALRKVLTMETQLQII